MLVSFFFNDTATTEIYTLSLHDALPIYVAPILFKSCVECHRPTAMAPMSLMSYEDARPWARAIKQKVARAQGRSEEHTSELQSLRHLVCRLLLEKKKRRSKTKQRPHGRR